MYRKGETLSRDQWILINETMPVTPDEFLLEEEDNKE